MFNIDASKSEVKTTADAILSGKETAERDRLEAEYLEYLVWLEANADQLAEDASDYDRYESGSYAW